MNDHTPPALAYHQAWTSKDMDTAMTYIANDIVCQAPAGPVHGAQAFREFMGPFAQIVTRYQLIAAFGDDTTAVLMYDTDTVPVQDAPARSASPCPTARSPACGSSSIGYPSTPPVAPLPARSQPVTSDVTERRQRRLAAQQLFDQLAVDYLDLPGVSRAAMFGSDGLPLYAKFFAFVGRDVQLIVKLPTTQPRPSSRPARPARYGPGVTPRANGSAYPAPTTGES